MALYVNVLPVSMCAAFTASDTDCVDRYMLPSEPVWPWWAGGEEEGGVEIE